MMKDTCPRCGGEMRSRVLLAPGSSRIVSEKRTCPCRGRKGKALKALVMSLQRVLQRLEEEAMDVVEANRRYYSAHEGGTRNRE